RCKKAMVQASLWAAREGPHEAAVELQATVEIAHTDAFVTAMHALVPLINKHAGHPIRRDAVATQEATIASAGLKHWHYVHTRPKLFGDVFHGCQQFRTQGGSRPVSRLEVFPFDFDLFIANHPPNGQQDVFGGVSREDATVEDCCGALWQSICRMSSFNLRGHARSS